MFFGGSLRLVYLCAVVVLGSAVLVWGQGDTESIDAIQSSCSNENPCATFADAVGRPLRFPEAFHSKDGVLEVTLDVEAVEFQISWLKFTTRMYNKGIPGPTMYINPGDTLRLKLVNHLPDNPVAEWPPYPDYSHPMTTNIHTHGLHIPGLPPGDDVVNIRVEPGETYQYEYKIPLDHTCGTFWYHPHVSGSAQLQLSGGMAGTIIVKDQLDEMPDDLSAISCPDNCDSEILLVMQHVLDYSFMAGREKSGIQRRLFDQYSLADVMTNSGQSLDDWLVDKNNHVNYFLVNGQLKPVITIPVKQARRVRLLNASGSMFLELGIDGCVVKLIARDGVYVDRPITVDRVSVGPAERVDVAVFCTKPGTFVLDSVPDPESSLSLGPRAYRYADVLATVVVTKMRRQRRSRRRESGSEPVQNLSNEVVSLPKSLPARKPYMTDLRGINRDCEPGERGMDCIWGRYAIEFSNWAMLNRAVMDERAKQEFAYKMPANTVTEFTLTAVDARHTHMMHMHVNHFQIISYNKFIGPVGVTTNNREKHVVFYDSNDGSECEVQIDPNVPNQCQVPPPGMYGAVPVERLGVPQVGHELQSHSEDGVGDQLGYEPLGQWRDTVTIAPFTNMTVRYYAHHVLGPVLMHCHISPHSDHGMALQAEIVDEVVGCTRVDKKNMYTGLCAADDFSWTQPVEGLCEGVEPEDAILGWSKKEE